MLLQRKCIEFHSCDHTIGFCLSCMLIWCFTCLGYIEFPHEKCKNTKLSPQLNKIWNWGYWHLLYLSVMNTLREIKENIATEKTDLEFHSFDHTIGFLSFWHIDLMWYMPMLCWEFPHEKCRKSEYHFSLKMNSLIPFVPFCDEYILRKASVWWHCIYICCLTSVYTRR